MKKEKIIRIKLQKDYPLVKSYDERLIAFYVELEKFLLKVYSMPEGVLRRIMGSDYIDTPGNYKREKEDYIDIFDYIRMSDSEITLEKFEEWYRRNPEKVKRIMKWK